MLAKKPASTEEQAQLSLTLEVARVAQQRQVFRVSELNAALARVLQDDFSGIWVAGEISGARMAPSGHYYFSLKDESSQVKAVLFKGSARYIRFKPQDGLAVIARGNLEVYEARGEYQLIIEALEPQGAGALQLAFEQLKKKLSAEGLFDAARKRALPALPRRIGVVTSPGGAVIRDMLHVLGRRFPGLHIRLYPAQVQGEGSVAQVCEGVAYFSQAEWAEVVIVARGGGSLEDLWTFNEEDVARAVAASRVPVISAIGHETDFTICDFVADHRAPTPSAAAEIVICTRESLLEQIMVHRTRALQSMRYRLMRCARDLHQLGTDRSVTLIHRALSRRSQKVDDCDEHIRRAIRRGLDGRGQRLAEFRRRLEGTDLRIRFARAHSRLNLLNERLHAQCQMQISRRYRKLESLTLHLQQMSPLTVLSRGYAIIQDPDGHALRSVAETEVGASLRVRLHKGNLSVIVNGKDNV